MQYDWFVNLTVAAALFANVAAVALITLKVRAQTSDGAREWLEPFQKHGMAMAAVVATVSTVGSLLYSEMVGFEPCRLCWWQRYFMYPLAALLLVAAWRRICGWARVLGLYTAIIGAGISIQHYWLQRHPELEGGSCSLEVPCSSAYIWRLEFVSIPYMAFSGFALVAVMLWLSRSSNESAH
jgi:disulfide bond formation protein DsbB